MAKQIDPVTAAMEAVASLSLTDVEDQIASVEAAKAEALEPFEQQLSALKAFRKMLMDRDGIKPERKTRVTRQPRESTSASDDSGDDAPAARGSFVNHMIAAIQSQGPLKVMRLAEDVGTTAATIYSHVANNSHLFVKDADGLVSLKK